jgi:hypothetical protein
MADKDDRIWQTQEEKAFWKEAYLVAMTFVSGNNAMVKFHDYCEEHAWEAVRRMRGDR